jgi:predicted dehydrogenase
MKSNEDSHDICVRVGILGWSDIARRKYVPALLQSGQACFVALASRRSGQGASLVSGTSAVMMTYEELINHPAVDLVYISLPNSLHEKWTIAALAHGKHVLCEKPLGLSAASVNRMLEAADRSGKLLYENLMYLQHPQHAAVRAIISSGRIGRIRSLRSEFAFPGPAQGDFRLDKAMGGGAFHDMNRYPLSAALFFLEGKDHRFVRGSADVRDGLTLSLQAESETEAGESFSFLVAFGQQYRSFYEITGERGSIRVERAYTTPADMENRIAVTVNGSDESFTVPPSDHFLGTIDRACELIRCGNWEAEHERSRKLAELAEMFQDNCTRG